MLVHHPGLEPIQYYRPPNIQCWMGGDIFMTDMLLTNRLLAKRILANRLLAKRLLAKRILAKRLLAKRLLANKLLAKRHPTNMFCGGPLWLKIAGRTRPTLAWLVKDKATQPSSVTENQVVVGDGGGVVLARTGSALSTFFKLKRGSAHSFRTHDRWENEQLRFLQN